MTISSDRPSNMEQVEQLLGAPEDAGGFERKSLGYAAR